jgi:glycosyltransferase involved in cell wall biosynthesis
LKSASVHNTLKLIIVIPCYNEETRFNSLLSEYHECLDQNKEVLLCFVDDGSTDKTQDHLNRLQEEFPNQVEILLVSKNMGKAEAVRAGMLHCHDNFSANHIGFLDADLATSFEEFLRVYSHTQGPEAYSFVFASRILKLGSVIKRTRFRFVVGRMIATIISSILRLKVYDTQCGSKVFEWELAKTLFTEKFISKWLFDVELFFRMIQLYGRGEAIKKMNEVPLRLWVDKGDSKVQLGYFFKMWVDLIRIRNHYKKENFVNKNLLTNNEA